MKKLLMILLSSFAISTITACGEGDEETPLPEQPGIVKPGNDDNEPTTSMKIKITTGKHTITATMEDNAAARDFLSRLPLEVTLSDFNNTTEKIFYPKPALTLEGVKHGCAPVLGDITIYAPWGNIAIFCKSWSYSNDLIKIGHVGEDGISALTVSGDIKVKFERQ